MIGTSSLRNVECRVKCIIRCRLASSCSLSSDSAACEPLLVIEAILVSAIGQSGQSYQERKRAQPLPAYTRWRKGSITRGPQNGSASIRNQDRAADGKARGVRRTRRRPGADRGGARP